MLRCCAKHPTRGCRETDCDQAGTPGPPGDVRRRGGRRTAGVGVRARAQVPPIAGHELQESPDRVAAHARLRQLLPDWPIRDHTGESRFDSARLTSFLRRPLEGIAEATCGRPPNVCIWLRAAGVAACRPPFRRLRPSEAAGIGIRRGPRSHGSDRKPSRDRPNARTAAGSKSKELQALLTYRIGRSPAPTPCRQFW